METSVIAVFEQILDSASYRLSAHASAVFLTSLAILSFGIYVLFREKNSSVKTAFFLVTLPAALWLFAFGGMAASQNQTAALVWAKAAYLGVPFIPAAIYYFTVKVLGLYDRKRALVFAAFAGAAFFSALIVGTDLVIDGLHHYSWGWYPRYTIFSFVYLIYFFGVMASALWQYLPRRGGENAETPAQKSRARLLLLAFSIAYFASVDYFPKFGVPLYPFGYLCILAFIAIAARVVTRWRLVDITPSFAAEKIIGTMPDALLVLDVENIVRVANDSASQLFQLPKSHLIGSPIASFSPCFPLKDTPDALHRVGQDHSHVMEHKLPDGRTLTLNVFESPMKDGMGCVVANVLVIRDISHLKAVETLARENESRFNRLYNEIPEAILVLDEFGRFASINPAAERLLNCKSAEMAGKIFVMSNFLSSTHVAKVLKAVRNTIQDVPEPKFDLEITRQDGVVLNLEVLPSPVRHSGRITGVQIILHDLTPSNLKS